MIFPNPRGIARIALDTETTGIGHTDVPVGVSYALPSPRPSGDAGYLSWGHQGGSNNTTQAQVVAWLRDLQPGTIVIFHNAMFDLRMLRNIGVDLVEQGCIIRDTQYAAAVNNELEPSYALGYLADKKLNRGKSDKALNEWCAEHFGGLATRRGQAKNYWRAPAHIVEEYAIDDAVLTLALDDYYRLNMSKEQEDLLEKIELPLIPVLDRMYKNGVRVNVSEAEKAFHRINSELITLADEWERLTDGAPLSGTGSKTALHEVWEAAGLPFNRTKKGNKSINKELLDSVDHPIARVLKDVRLREKVTGTFLSGYFLDAHHNGRVHPTFHPLRTDQYGTVSGRFSSSDPNFQNLFSPDRDDKSLPVKDQYGRLIRTLVLPEEDSLWAKIDYSQIEYRFFGHYAGGQIRDAYLNNPDIDFHGWCAETAGVSRSVAKNGNFAKLYGAGIRRLASTLGVSVEEAKRFITEYDQAIPEAADLYTKAMVLAGRRGWIQTWGGRRRRFRRDRRGFQGTHAALNALLQGSAADLMKIAMLRVEELIDWKNTFLHLTVHDELDLSIPKGEAGRKFLREAQEVMTDFPDITVPIKADVEVGATWGDVEEIEL